MDRMLIDWNSPTSHILINPRYSSDQQKLLYTILDHSPYEAHVWISTSGSTQAKWAGLSKKAILVSAQAVNDHLLAQSSDIWVHALPDFHVGGLGIWARSFLNGARVKDFKKIGTEQKWNPKKFCDFTDEVQGTLTALVPTQIYDLVLSQIKSPTTLRAVIIGGGKLSSELYLKAIDLGWKLLPSYGLTECASQVATAELDSWTTAAYPRLRTLKHLGIKKYNDVLAFKGPSLITAYATFQVNGVDFIDPKHEGWFVSEDRGNLKGHYLELFGRCDQVIKIGGENVDMVKLESLLQNIRLQTAASVDMTLVSMPDVRLGNAIHLAIASEFEETAKPIYDLYQAQVLPFERIHKIHFVPFIPRSPLYKVLKEDLLKLIEKI